MPGDENTQLMTQHEVDPRRLGRNNSGLAENDIADVLCILHPSSPAAFRIVKDTLKRNPQHVLQREHPTSTQENNADGQTDRLSFEMELEELIGTNDLALRFSSRVCDAAMGFVFGRNTNKCDILLDASDQQKRVSNTHFRIYVNQNGVLMLADTSTNGTIVDGENIGGKRYPTKAKARMIKSGSIIEILAQHADDAIKFVVREPAREGFFEQYTANLMHYLNHVAVIEQNRQPVKDLKVPEGAVRGMIAAPLQGPPNQKQLLSSAPLMKSNHGMHWNGGGQYNCVGVLGTGAFATVYVIATVHDGDLFACKELEKKRFVKNGVLDHRLSNEMSIMQQLRHESIVQYMNYHETDQHLYIIMEYVRYGDLQGYMKSHNTLPEHLAKEMTQQIMLALRYLHGQGITHRDIKPDNILLCSEEPFRVKLTDFGLSKMVKNNDTFLKTFCGTLLYCAPEVFPHFDGYMAGKKPKRRRHDNDGPRNHMYGQSVDIWSYAAVLWYCLCGQPPFEGVVDQTGRAMFERIVETSVDTTPLRQRGLSDDCIDFLVKMLTVDPLSRPTDQDCLNHPWLNGGVQMTTVKEGPIGLGVVLEEEPDAANELDMVGESNVKFDSQESQESRALKKQKGALLEDPTVLPDSTSAQDPTQAAPEGTNFKPQRLFGEITNSALRSSGVLGGHDLDLTTASGHDTMQVAGNSNATGQPHAGARDNQRPPPPPPPIHLAADSGPVGFESMVRELNMDSGTSNSNSYSDEFAKPEEQARQTPSLRSEHAVHADGTPHQRQGAFERTQTGSGLADDTTPRPPPASVFSRQINLGLSPSFFYDPMDPRTHNPESASKVSGIDFTKTDNILHVDTNKQASTKINQHDDNETHPKGVQFGTVLVTKRLNDLNVQNERSQELASNFRDSDGFLKPNTMLGRVTSAAGSFANVNISLNARRVRWGRHKGSTCVFPDTQDTRVPKEALEIQFYARGIEELEAEKKDWTSMEGLKAYVRTFSRKGININGELLRNQDESGRPLFGVLRKGDVISIWENWKDHEYLRLVVDIYAGASSKPRGAGEEFRVETDFGGSQSAAIKASRE